MESKKDLIGTELMKELITIRLDTLWKMLALKKENRLPEIFEEGATGAFDNKGAIFVPGGFVFVDSDGRPAVIDPFMKSTVEEFRNRVRQAMRFDNAILLYPNGLAPAVNLNNGFFADMASRILAIKQAAMARIPLLKVDPPVKITSSQLTRSYSPTCVPPPYGARTKLSSCLGACFIEPMIYYVQCRTTFGLRGAEEKDFWESVRNAHKPILGKEGTVLANPYVVVCHNTRYRKESLTGIIRILGFGKFGEMAVFTLEEATNDLLNELEGGKTDFTAGDLFVEYEGTRVVGVLRIFPKTTPGRRLARTTAYLVSPGRDLDLDLEKITKEAWERYKIS